MIDATDDLTPAILAAVRAAITIRADGTIMAAGAIIDARIGGSSPREFFRLSDPSAPRIDVTHVWQSADLPAIVAALLAGTDLPAPYYLGARRDGMRMVRRDDVASIGVTAR
jgi:hypothetical protein